MNAAAQIQDPGLSALAALRREIDALLTATSVGNARANAARATQAARAARDAARAALAVAGPALSSLLARIEETGGPVTRATTAIQALPEGTIDRVRSLARQASAAAVTFANVVDNALAVGGYVAALREAATTAQRERDIALQQRRGAETALTTTQRLLTQATERATAAERARDLAARQRQGADTSLAATQKVLGQAQQRAATLEARAVDAERKAADAAELAAQILAQREEALALLAQRDSELAALRPQLAQANTLLADASRQLAEAQNPVKTAEGQSVLTADAAALVEDLRTRLAEAIENGGRCDGAAADLAARLRRAEATAADHAALTDQLRARLEAQSTAAWLVPSLTGLLGVLLGRSRS